MRNRVPFLQPHKEDIAPVGALIPAAVVPVAATVATAVPAADISAADPVAVAGPLRTAVYEPRISIDGAAGIELARIQEAGASLVRGDPMKTVTVRDLQKRVRECVDIAQDDRVVITRHGRPTAVLVGIEGEEWEDVVLQTSAPFWRLIEKRRQEPTISIEEMKAKFAKPKRKRRS